MVAKSKKIYNFRCGVCGKDRLQLTAPYETNGFPWWVRFSNFMAGDSDLNERRFVCESCVNKSIMESTN